MTQTATTVDLIDRRIPTRTLHRAVKYGGMVHFAGVVADNWDTDMAGQTREVCGKLEALLSEAGSSVKQLLSAQIFITDMGRKSDMDDVWLKWLDARDLPARATIGVSDLGDPRILIEIVATAAI